MLFSSKSVSLAVFVGLLLIVSYVFTSSPSYLLSSSTNDHADPANNEYATDGAQMKHSSVSYDDDDDSDDDDSDDGAAVAAQDDKNAKSKNAQLEQDTTEQNEISIDSHQLMPDCNMIHAKNPSPLSKRPHEKSAIQSPFNCDLDTSLCKYYYPADFFHETCGIGKAYIQYQIDAEEMRKNQTLWKYMPSVGFPTLTMKNTCLQERMNSKGNQQIFNSEDINQGRHSDNGNNRMKMLSAANNFMKGTKLNEATLHNIGLHTLQVDLPSSAITNETNDDNTQTITCMTERLSMIHVHKVGGSSLHAAFDYLERAGATTQSTQQVRHKFFSPSRRPSPRSPRLPLTNNNDSSEDSKVIDTSHHVESKLYNMTLDALGYATRYPSTDSYEPQQHLIIAMVRDPTERFISSIGQALGAKGSEGNHVGPTLRKACVSNEEITTSSEALKCIAKYVQEHSFWIELHFTPQVIDISFTTLWADVPIAIFPFKQIKTVLNYFGSGSEQRRDGKQDNYRTDKILSNMSVEDYDDETLEIVCQIYEMDVLMQRSLGMEVGRCDKYIPKV